MRSLERKGEQLLTDAFVVVIYLHTKHFWEVGLKKLANSSVAIIWDLLLPAKDIDSNSQINLLSEKEAALKVSLFLLLAF